MLNATRVTLCVWLGLVFAAPVQAAPRAPDSVRLHFNLGKKLYAQNQYKAARTEFKRALRLRRHPVILFNIALTSAMMKDHVDATRHGREYLKKTTGADRVLPAVLRDSMSRTGVLLIRSKDPDAILFVGGKRIGPSPVEHVVMPGTHIVTLQKEGRERARQKVRVDAGRKARVVLRFPRHGLGSSDGNRTGDKGGRKAGVHWAWFTTLAVVTVGLAAGATWASFGAKKAHDDFLANRSDGSLRDKGIRLETTANVLWGVTAAAGVTAVILAIFTRWSAPKKEQSHAPVVTPLLSPTGAGVTLTWRR